MGHAPWGPYPFPGGPGGPPGPQGAPGAPGQGRQSQNQTPSGQDPTQKPAPIGPAADRKSATSSQQPAPPSEPKAMSQASKQPVPPTPPVESKPSAEEVKAAAASVPANGAPTAAPAFPIPTGPKSGRGPILPAVPLPVGLTSKSAQNQGGKAPADAPSAAAAAAALENATQAAKDAVAAAMAQLHAPSGVPQLQPQQQHQQQYQQQQQQLAETNGAVNNLAKRVDEMRINAARGGQNNRGGRGGRGPRPAKVEVPDTDFDFASSNAKFNKQDVVKEAVASSPLNEAPPSAENDAPEGASDGSAPVEQAYNKTKSFFDNISSEMKDRENSQRAGGVHWRGEEVRRNLETFGQGSVDGGHRGFRGGRGRGRGGRGRGHRGRGGNGGFRQPQAAPQQ